MEWYWWLLAFLIAPIAWIGFKVLLSFAIPNSVSGKALLKQLLAARGIAVERLPDQFFLECVSFSERVARFQGSGSKVREKAALVENLETVAEMAQLWVRDKNSTTFQATGGQPSAYAEIFSRYDLGKSP